MAFVCIILASCSGKEDYKTVAEKIASGATLDQKDYSTMIDYCADYAEKAQPYFDIINSNDETNKEYIDASGSLAEMASKAIYLDTFRQALFAANADELGEANVKRMDELSKYEAFPIADVSNQGMLNPDVVGDIEDMPATDTGNVIATGDGEVVTTK